MPGSPAAGGVNVTEHSDDVSRASLQISEQGKGKRGRCWNTNKQEWWWYRER